ncbi:hypothetical protein TWF132_009928 [Orbilia oligospora]|nr:hypothetical protein TWF751_010376 [Orbilia oligospora]KAF3284043.1 hypothetical protein TWF132_009928 [Orbilia oligospora]
MSSDSKATAGDAASANRLKFEDDDHDLENDTPIGTTTAGGAPSSTTTSSDVAHRKSKPGINRKKGPSTGKDDGGAESIANGGSSGSINGSGNVRKRSAANNGEELNGHEEVKDEVPGGNALAAAPPTSSSPPPAPASSSSNGKVSKRRKVNHGLSTVAPDDPFVLCPGGLNLPNRLSAFLRVRAGRNKILHLKGLYHTALRQPR